MQILSKTYHEQKESKEEQDEYSTCHVFISAHLFEASL